MSTATTIPDIFAGTALPGSDAVSDARRKSKSVWLIHPIVDILFCCGGGVWLIAGFLYWVNKTSAGQPAWVNELLFFTLIVQYLFSDAHTAASYVRIYGTAEARRKWAFINYVIPLICFGFLIYGLSHPETTAVFPKIYTIWVMQHWMSQIYGVGLVYYYRAGYPLTKWDKRSYWLMLHTTGLLVVLQTFLPESRNLFFIMPLPFWGPIPPWIYDFFSYVFALATLGFVVGVARNWLYHNVLPPLPVAILTLTGVMIQLPHVTLLNGAKLYALGLYHGAQYLVVSAAFYLKEHAPAGTPPERVGALMWKPVGWKFWAMTVAGGIFVYMVIPKMIQDFTKIPVGHSFPIVFSLVNFHHFIVDSTIWKLRKPEVAKVLVPAGS